MVDIFTSVKEGVEITSVVEYFGIEVSSSGKANCPFHSDKSPSFVVDKKNNTFKFFGCGEGGDAVNFVSKLKGIPMVDAAKLIATAFNISCDDNACSIKPKTSTVTEYIKKCMLDIGNTNYFEGRGLSKATIRKFCLGYDEYRNSVVVPYSSKLQYYQTRGTVDKVFFKPKTEDAGSEPLFNVEGMRLKSKEPIFVVESPLCAMSIYQSGGNAISTCGTAGWRKIIDIIKESKPLGGFILCFDNDEPGTKAQDLLLAELVKLQIKCVVHNIAGSCKDPNELLMKAPKKLETNIKDAKLALRRKYASAKDSFDARELQEQNIEPPEWIVKDVLPIGLALLCAPSKIGKSWMMLQLGLAVAKGKEFLDFKTNKCGCLYYALEDSKARLQDRMNKMLRGSEAPSDLHFVLKADSTDKGLLDKISDELKTFPNIKLVIVDTLQKVRGKSSRNESLYSTDYAEMGALKEFADKHKICLMFVHHLRKQADDADVFNMISGSTAIMGASDSIFIIAKKKRTDDSATLSMTGRDIQQNDLVVSFDKNEFSWLVEGTSEQLMARSERQDYESNVIVQTIKELVKSNPLTGWSGSALDLMKATYNITGKQCAESSSGVGKLISKYSYKLYCDGIDHKAAKSNTRTHTFTKKQDYMPSYQRTIYD